MEEISFLFALEAEELINNNMLDEAIALCEAGLKIYPDYAAAVAILSHAYSIRGDREKSVSIIEQHADKIIQTTVTRLKSRSNKEEFSNYELPDLTKSSLSDIDANQIMIADFYSLSDKFDSQNEDENGIISESQTMAYFYSTPNNHKFASKYKMKINKNVSLAPDETFIIDDISGLPITETFADILTRQGNFRKAVKILKELKLNEPHKTEYFEGKIREIEQLIKSNALAK